MGFEKRVGKWGLLGGVEGRPWRWLNNSKNIFDSEVDACREALRRTSKNYRYKPVQITLEYEYEDEE